MALKVCFIGTPCSGKTRVVDMLMGIPERSYVTTDGVSIKTVKIPDCPVLNIWDCGSVNRGLYDGYYIGSHMAVVFGKANRMLVDFNRVCNGEAKVVMMPKNLALKGTQAELREFFGKKVPEI